MLAISDIHGEIDMFNRLLEKVKYTPSTDQLILLGDYVDRGPHSKEVLNRVIALKEEGAIVLRGNHDEMMVEVAETESERAWRRWERNGSIYTLHSYDPTIKERTLPQSEVFDTHVEFIQQLDYYYETDDHIFVHAGVDPNKPLEERDPYDLVWIRDQFYEKYQGEKTVIFGHTRTARLHGDPTNHEIYFGENNVIGIDGGAVYGGQLNCYDVTNQKAYKVVTKDR